jgi:pyridoxal/pyridoxine/pyridoxamine kinase
MKMLNKVTMHHSSKYYKLRHPLLMILKAVSKKLLLNSYECIVLCYLLSINHWDINVDVIEKNKLKLPDVIFINDPLDYE